MSRFVFSRMFFFDKFRLDVKKSMEKNTKTQDDGTLFCLKFHFHTLHSTSCLEFAGAILNFMACLHFMGPSVHKILFGLEPPRFSNFSPQVSFW